MMQYQKVIVWVTDLPGLDKLSLLLCGVCSHAVLGGCCQSLVESVLVFLWLKLYD